MNCNFFSGRRRMTPTGKSRPPWAHTRVKTALSGSAIGDARTLDGWSVTSSVHLTEAASVANLRDADGGRSGDLETARELMTVGLDEGTALLRDDVTTLVLTDEDGICCQRPGRELDRQQIFTWPLNDPEWGGQDSYQDYFSSAIFGKLTVDDGDAIRGETLPVTFGLFSSDGAQLHIHGVDFQKANGSGDVTYGIDGDQTLSFPEITANSDALGLVELTEGQVYDFDAIHFDNRGDAGFELWAALGDRVDRFDAQWFFPVSQEPAVHTIPRNVGLSFVTSESQLVFDFNGDGQLDVDDLTQQIQAFSTADTRYDLNRDGTLDVMDLQYWVHRGMHTWLGDANLDGQFDSTDLVTALTAGVYNTGAWASWSDGDWNGDGYFTTSDLVVALQDGGYGVGPRTAATPVPEPSAIWMLVLGIPCGSRRRRDTFLATH